ncbi:stage III sporulation protein AG [Bacillus pseudomycoides]|uniref:Stage III sporulation protein AG n=1 Tax=Bacillus pseudomycoides TaxID=64104 RepID=A0AA91VEI7_9BACI|nr:MULTISPECIES: stage III sporulation protein AG [Bacillus]PEB53280.1 stage III sporulation protein AG [Bacillus sp. AFS098217]PED83851.1 stage III sporulation protein AG [Bacillus pseudomycoides]PEU14679.1 stage III sporulation protein AG [Bacillus sp. AFS019443]PEU19568.1 stage III sporulation protein AG [Bacillus sp. AFS014408]PFW64350.1 stage III sporulation protein AG [Bacillus sp. AFS075034]
MDNKDKNLKFSFFRNLLKGDEKDDKEKGKKVTPKFLLVLLILGILLMFSSNFFQTKKEEVPVFKEKTSQDSGKDVPTFGQKNSDNMSIVEKYEKAYEQELKSALEDITGVKDVSITVNLDSSEEKILEKNTVKRSQTTSETDKTGGTRKVEDESLDEKTVIIREGDKETPVVLRTEKPKVRGVLVVAKGVDNIQIKAMVKEAVTRMLDVPSHRVAVLPKKG